MDDKDRHHLPNDGKPAKLNQQKQVLPVGYVVNGNRPAPVFDQACSATVNYTAWTAKKAAPTGPQRFI
jgi:hypothetical protein